jgi:hypothetical protein
MNMTAWIDVAIGLSLVFLGTALFVTIINEYISQLFNLRGEHLYQSLKTLVTDQKIKEILSASPVLKSFFDGDSKNKPSYVDTVVAAKLLVGGLLTRPVNGNSADDLTRAVDDLSDSEFKQQLTALIRISGNQVEQLTSELSRWLDQSLSVLGEKYQRHMRLISLGIGIVVAGAMNIDAIDIAKTLYQNKEARDATLVVAAQIADKTQHDNYETCVTNFATMKTQSVCEPFVGLVAAIEKRNKTLGVLPIGWDQAKPDGCIEYLYKIIGILLTGLAVSLGAPFWFDLLNKLVNVRHGMRKPGSSSSKSRTEA